MRIQISATVLLVLGISTASLAEDPNPKAKFEPLLSHAVLPVSKPVWEKMVQQDESIRQLVERIYKDRNGPDAKQFQKLYLLVEQYRRWLKWLEAYQEPAAVDFKYREAYYSKAMLEIAPKAWGSPQGQKLQQGELKALTRSNEKRLESLKRVLATLDGGDAQAAELAFYKIYDSVYNTAGILTPKQKMPYGGPISTTETRVEQKMGGIRRARTVKAIGEDRRKFVGFYEALNQRVSDAANQIANGKLEYQGKEMDGPEAVGAFISEFRNAHRGILRVTAFSSSGSSGRTLGGSAGSYGSEGYSESGEEASSKQGAPSEELARELCGSFLDALGRFISADASATEEANAKDKLTRYRVILSDFTLRLADESWMKKMGPVLGGLARKAGIQTELVAYDAATRDLLRWRGRAAAAKVKAMTASVPTAPELGRQSLMSDTTTKGIFAKNYTELPWLQSAIPDLVPVVEKALVGKQVQLGSVIKLDSSAPIWMSRFESNFYSKLDVSRFISHAEVKDLETDLLVGDGSQPLTILASAAIVSAKQGRYEAAGGEIQGFALEGALSRFSALPSVASDLVRYGEVQQKSSVVSPNSVLTVRLEVEPKWVQHRYFVLTSN